MILKMCELSTVFILHTFWPNCCNVKLDIYIDPFFQANSLAGSLTVYNKQDPLSK